MMKSYGGLGGSGIGQMDCPIYLTIDDYGFIFVADSDNNRIIELNASLECIHILESVGLKYPSRMHSHERTKRLYIVDEKDIKNFNCRMSIH